MINNYEVKVSKVGPITHVFCEIHLDNASSDDVIFNLEDLISACESFMKNVRSTKNDNCKKV